MDRDSLRSLIAEEIARPEVQQALSPEPRLAEVIRHPLTLTVVGFLLTAVVGTYLEGIVSRSTEARAAREARVSEALQTESAARDALLDLARLAHERAVRADLLRSAIARDAASLEDRKAAYDKAYVAWNVGLKPALVRLRLAFATSPEEALAPHLYEELVSTHVAGRGGGFAVADACLTQAFDARTTDGEFVAPVCAESADWASVSRAEVQRAVGCVELILEDGFRLARAQAAATVRSVTVETGGPEGETPRADARLIQQCGAPS